MRRRRGLRAQQATYNHLSREIAKQARDSRLERAHAALRLCLLEIEQFHSRAYPDCDGGCPAHEAMAAARSVLGPPPLESGLTLSVDADQTNANWPKTTPAE